MIDILRPGRIKPKAIQPLILSEWSSCNERVYEVCDGVIDVLSTFFNVSGRDLRAHSRCSRPIARVRQVGMYVAHVTLELNMAEVGRAFGRDRSTVNHACQTIEDLREEPEFDRIIHTIENILRATFLRYGTVRR
ncbi:chromosomal replication initiator DnaA [Phyllobacterium sp. 628]|nr:chromosomal replication initiator DnaA [Phyllobacterium sp. 628]